jgi:bifunctional DNA-binding transcriptional regulator/antitoxin component of YhaV-PrlF toxin-antitoxin module
VLTSMLPLQCFSVQDRHSFQTRRLSNLREGDELTISVEGQSVKVQKLDATCTFCDSTEQDRSLYGKGICTNCTAELSDLSY